MTDLPALPEDVDVDSLDPEQFLDRPPVDHALLTLDSIRPMREWLAKLTTPPEQREPGDGVFYFDMSGDIVNIEQSLTTLIEDYRRQGIDLYNRRDLLSSCWSLQASIIGCMAALDMCVADLNSRLHAYTHFAMPLSNLAIGFELLILDVFGEEASLLIPEGGE